MLVKWKINLISLLLGLIVLSYGAHAFEPLFVGSVTKSFDKTMLDNFVGQLGFIDENSKTIKLFMLAPKEFVFVSTAQGQDVDRKKDFRELPATQRHAAIYIRMLQAYLTKLSPESLPSYADFIDFIDQLKTAQKPSPLEIETVFFKCLSQHSKNYVRILFKDRPDSVDVNQYNIRFLLEHINAVKEDYKNNKAKKELKAKLLQNKLENTSPAEKPKRKLVRKAQQTPVLMKENVENHAGNSLQFIGEE